MPKVRVVAESGSKVGNLERLLRQSGYDAEVSGPGCHGVLDLPSVLQ